MVTPSKRIGNFAAIDMKKAVEVVIKAGKSKEKDDYEGICFASSCKK